MHVFHGDPLDEKLEVMPLERIEELELLSLIHISDALKQLTEEDIANCKPHHQKYVAWMKAQMLRF